MKKFLGAWFAMLISGVAVAGTFEVPNEAPALTVTVPDNWRPNHSEDGVDAASPDNSVFFSIATFAAGDCAAARDDAVKFLTRNGMTIDLPSATVSAWRLAGVQTTQTLYSAEEDGKAKQVMITVAPLSANLCLQLAQWGVQKGFQRNAGGLKKIFDSIRLLDK